MKILNKGIISATYELGIEFENNRYNVIFTSAQHEDRVESIWSEQIDDVLDEHDPEHFDLFKSIADAVEEQWQVIVDEQKWADYQANIDNDFKTFNEAPYGND